MNNYFFINPVLVIQKGDFLGSGIPYMPHILAYTVGLVEKKYPSQIIDAFGQNPFKITLHNDFYWQGIEINEILSQIINPGAIFLYASSITNVDFNLQLTKEIKKRFGKTKIIILANTQAVTSFNISFIAKEFFKSGANTIIYNNIEKTTLNLIKNNLDSTRIDNCLYVHKKKIITTPMSQEIGETNKLILPAWHKFPLENYWKIGYGHGPIEGKYLPLLTSYGCPFHCEFCVNPSINKSRWQAKSAQNVFKEIRHLVEYFGINELHIEDLNPTVNKKRIQELCHLIIDKKLKITWKIVSGTKVETLDEKTLKLMKKAGCAYLSVSPESGSPDVLKLMKKPFNFRFADKIIMQCNRINIKIQACFVLGFPGETETDIAKTKTYIHHITRLGLDEVAIFIATPLPGTALYDKLTGYQKLSSLTFTPTWRQDYDKLEIIRSELYRTFIFSKCLYHPKKIIKQVVNILTQKFKTKMEMIPFRMFRFKLLLLKNHV